MAEEYGRLPEEEVLGQIPGLMDGELKEGALEVEGVGKGCQCIHAFEKHYVGLAIEELLAKTKRDKEGWTKAFEEELKKPEAERVPLFESMRGGGKVYDFLMRDLETVYERFQAMPSC